MKKATEARRFVHLGERLTAIERVRAGQATLPEAAAELGVSREQLLQWMDQHGNDRLVTLAELRGGDARAARLASRARRLAVLLAAAERRVRELHLELLSKKFGDKPHARADDVSHAQPIA